MIIDSSARDCQTVDASNIEGISVFGKSISSFVVEGYVADSQSIGVVDRPNLNWGVEDSDACDLRVSR